MMKISKKESNFEIEISAEEITSLSGLLKNDNAMELVSGILRYFQVQYDRERFEESIKKQEEELTKTKIEEVPFTKTKQKYKASTDQTCDYLAQINKSEDNDTEYFIGVPNTSDDLFVKNLKRD